MVKANVSSQGYEGEGGVAEQTAAWRALHGNIRTRAAELLFVLHFWNVSSHTVSVPANQSGIVGYNK